MRLPRQQFPQAATLPTLPRISFGLDYLTRPIHLVVGYPPGGSTDLVARLIRQAFSERMNQQFVVYNRPGAGTTIESVGRVTCRPTADRLPNVSIAWSPIATAVARVPDPGLWKRRVRQRGEEVGTRHGRTPH